MLRGPRTLLRGAGTPRPRTLHVAHRLADAGVPVARVPSNQVGRKRVEALRRYLCEHAKTDLADAPPPRLDPVHIPAPKSHALQRLTKQRGHLQDTVASAKRRLLDLIPST